MHPAAENARKEAEAIGLRWDDVQTMYRELREREKEQRRWKWNIRREAWDRAGYRSGAHWKLANRNATNGGDMASIVGFDGLAQGMAMSFPELGSTDSDEPARKLWSLLTELVDRLPPPEKTYREAIELLVDSCYHADECLDELYGEF